MPQLAEVVTTIKKHTQTVPWSEVAPLLNQVRTTTNSSLTEVLDSIGYSSSSAAANWRERGQAPTRAKYALLGMLAELHVKVENATHHDFTFDELTGLFAALNGWTIPEEARRALVKKVTKLIQDTH